MQGGAFSCEDVFTPSSVAMMGNARCEVRGMQLVASMDAANTVIPGSTIVLAEGTFLVMSCFLPFHFLLLLFRSFVNCILESRPKTCSNSQWD